MQARYDDAIYATVARWSEQALLAIRKSLPLMTPVGQYQGFHPGLWSVVGRLLGASARSTESALLLTHASQLWDAEVIARTVTEATLKAAYILQSPATFEQRALEFSSDHFEIGRLKDHQKALDLLEVVSDASSDDWAPIRERLLSDDELSELRATYPKHLRRALETRWGFAGLVRELSSSADPLFDGLKGIAHDYALASHISHADLAGVEMPIERDRRDTERREAIHLAHAARLIEQCVRMFQVRLIVGYRFVGQPASALGALRSEVEQLSREFQAVYEKWLAIERRYSAST